MGDEVKKTWAGSRAYEVGVRTLGVRTTLRSRSFLVGTSVTQILNENPRRIGWSICNCGTTYVEISHERGLLPGGGLLLTGEGGTIVMTVVEDGETTGYSVFGVSIATPSTIHVMEILAL